MIQPVQRRGKRPRLQRTSVKIPKLPKRVNRSQWNGPTFGSLYAKKGSWSQLGNGYTTYLRGCYCEPVVSRDVKTWGVGEQVIRSRHNAGATRVDLHQPPETRAYATHKRTENKVKLEPISSTDGYPDLDVGRTRPRYGAGFVFGP